MNEVVSFLVGALIVLFAIKILYANIKNNSKGNCSGCSCSKNGSKNCNCCRYKTDDITAYH